MPITFKWHDSETGEPYSETQEDISWDADPHCPKCGKLTHYWEGQIDQDFMGNDIDGWNHVCYECHLGTELQELD